MDIVERLGRYSRTLNPGMRLLVPVVDKVRSKVDMREAVQSFPPQPVITSDNLVVNIDTVLYYRVDRPGPGHLRDRELPPGDRAADRDHAA